MTIIAVQEWPMPKTFRDSSAELCECGHSRDSHRYYGDGEQECVDCEQDPRPTATRCEWFRLSP